MSTHNAYASTVAGLMALALVLSPLSSFAKEKEARAERADKAGTAYGHLVAPGWIKKNGSTTPLLGGWLPFGIAKKLGLTGTSTGTTTADVTGPSISSIVSYPSQTKAKIAWATDEKSDSAVYYATSSAALEATSSAQVSKAKLVKEHEVVLSNLTASTTYYFKVFSKDAAGNTSSSSVMTFTTMAPDVMVTYPAISNVAVTSGTSTVSVSWKTNEPATTKVYYGVGSVDTNASSTKYAANLSLTTDHSITVAGLATSTAYSLVIESRNAAGNASLSNSLSATTGI